MKGRDHRRDPKSLSDGELARICAATPRENALGVTGCLGSLAMLLVVYPLAIAGFFKSVFVGFVLGIPAVFWTLHLVGLPKRAYREELAWRRGTAPFSRYMEEAQIEIVRSGADWIILFTLRSLPHGGFRWLRLTLTEGPPAQAHARLRISKQELPDRRVDGNLPEGPLQELLAMLKELDLPALTDIFPGVKDGAPCRIAVLRREPETVALGSCNLGGLTDDQRRLPTVDACLKLAGIACGLSSEG